MPENEVPVLIVFGLSEMMLQDLNEREEFAADFNLQKVLVF